MRILFITNSIPFPILGGASLRNYNLLRRLAVEHEVRLAAFAKNAEQIEAVQHMKQFCKSVDFVEAGEQSALSDFPNFIRYVLNGIPPDMRLNTSNELIHLIQQRLSQFQFDVIHIDQLHMGLYLGIVPPDQQHKTLWSLHDVDFVRYKRIIQLEPKKTRKIRLWFNNQFLYHWEPRFAAKFGRCITVSELDKQLLLDENPALKIEVIPNGVDTVSFASGPEVQERHALIFVGNMGYLPCIDAINYFCGQILPMIRQAVPDVEFWVVGRDPPESIKRLNGNGIHVTGRVQDVRPFYEQSTVCVVPLRAGGGTRLKILEAMATGRPVISTSIGCEGLNLVDNEQILIADDPASFAQKSIELLTNPSLRKQISTNSRRFMESCYDWSVIVERLIEVYQQVAAS